MYLIAEQMDVETAFLHRKLKNKVAMQTLQGLNLGVNKVCRLLKTLYGLKESAKTMYGTKLLTRNSKISISLGQKRQLFIHIDRQRYSDVCVDIH